MLRLFQPMEGTKWYKQSEEVTPVFKWWQFNVDTSDSYAWNTKRILQIRM